MCGYFCIVSIDFMLHGEGLLDYTNLFSSKKYIKNDKKLLKHFQWLKNLRLKKYTLKLW